MCGDSKKNGEKEERILFSDGRDTCELCEGFK